MIDHDMMKNWRGRRLNACHAADQLIDIVNNLGVEDGSVLPREGGNPLPPSDQIKRELHNSIKVLLRLILIYNDETVSPQKLNGF